MSSDDEFAKEAMEDAAVYSRTQGRKPQKKSREESAKEYKDGVVALCKLLGEWKPGFLVAT